MVFIFALLSLMLTLGGGATALYGADLIRSESGLALTQAGVTMTSAGLLLMGLTAVLAELRKMRRLMELEEAAPAPLPAPRAPVVMPAIDLPPLQQPAPAQPVDIPTPTSAPKIPFSMRDIDPPERPLSGGGIPAEAMASLVSSTPLVRGKGGSGGRVEPVASPAPPPPPPAEPAKMAEASSGAPPASAVPATEPPTMVASDGPRRMLATYNAGGITYFMYSDGSIEADLTAGRHRFGSMQELRHYIETGEGGTPVPASEAASEPTPAAGT